MDNNLLYDFVLQCRDGEINAHKAFLITNSQYFVKHIEYSDGTFAGLDDSYCELNYTKAAVEIIINIIYQKNYINITKECLLEALRFCDEYLFNENIKYKLYIKYNNILYDNSYFKTIYNIKDEEIMLMDIPDINYIDVYNLWYPAVFSEKKEIIYDPKIRNTCVYYTGIKIISSRILEEIKESIYYGDFEWYDTSPGNIHKAVKILKYSAGCKFTKHIDKKKYYRYVNDTENNNGKILLIKYLPGTRGGHLIVDDRVIFDDSTNRGVWNYYFLPNGVLHEVTEVLEGVRYTISIPTFKEEIEYYYSDDSGYNDED